MSRLWATRAVRRPAPDRRGPWRSRRGRAQPPGRGPGWAWRACAEEGMSGHPDTRTLSRVAAPHVRRVAVSRAPAIASCSSDVLRERERLDGGGGRARLREGRARPRPRHAVAPADPPPLAV